MTTLTATPQAGTALLPPRVLLQVAAAPVQPTNAYASNFATVDGWSGASAAIVFGNTLRLSGSAGQPAGTTSTGSRTLTGLAIGAVYKYRANLTTQTQTQARLRLSGGAQGAYVITPGAGAWLELTFTATATSHVITIDLQNTSAGTTPIVDVTSVTVQPSGTWQGTTIRRTDVNGTSVIVREDAGGLDTVAGSLTLTDFEAALTGPITYVVTDGAGATTTTVTTLAVEARRNRVYNPSFETNTTFWAATRGTITRTAHPLATSGAYVCSYASTDASTAGGNQVNTALIPVEAGVKFTASAYVRAQVVDSPHTIALNWYTAGGAFISGVTYTTPGNIGGAVLSRIAVTGTAPATATQARIVTFPTLAMPVGAGFLIDAVLLEVGDLGAYFDGSTAEADPLRTHAWSSLAHNSQSVESGPSLEPYAWLTIPASSVPSAGTIPARPLELVTDYAEESASNGSLHTIIGRTDPIANPGPLALRAGTIEAFCSNYTTAKRVRDLLAAGDVAQLRQPTNPGMDMYVTAQRVSISPAGTSTDPQRWLATITYAEVLAT